MPDTTKRLDLQFGVFACSVQGFDDPVQPVQQVLQALQNLLEETPEIADAGISFDAEAIERLIGEVARRADIAEENVEIVPGLIIVHRSRDNAAAGKPEAVDARYDEGEDDGEGGEAWSRPFVAGAADTGDTEPLGAEPADAEIMGESREPEADEDAEPAYVNIFNPGAGAGAGDDDGSGPDSAPFGDTAETDPAGADPHAAVEDDQDDAPPRDIFADTGGSASDSVFADPMAANTGAEPVDEAADEDDPVNFFAAPDQADEGGSEPGGAGPGDVDPGDHDNVFTSIDSEDAGEVAPEEPGEPDGEPERVESLFGRSEDQPEVEEADEGYTAAGLAQAAGAETVAELMVTAAAWMVLIQGRTTFTRRDVIEVFETIPGEHSKTLEARIKGFGRAVRNSQLVMVEDGVFGLSRTELERFQLLL
ncbi:MAG: hypothetical protein ACTSVG_09600 [Alphaproteobacteria bacterium]